MGTFSFWKCITCDYTVMLRGPWEFYRDARGHRRPYGHPEPVSKKAEESGIKGFSVTGWCSECKTVKDAIIVEFEEPRDYTDAWMGIYEASAQRVPLCSKCGTELKVEMEESDTCPKCHKGKFELSKIFQT